MDTPSNTDPKFAQFITELNAMCDRYGYLIRPTLQISTDGLGVPVLSVVNKPPTFQGLENHTDPSTANPKETVVPAAADQGESANLARVQNEDPNITPEQPKVDATLPNPDPAFPSPAAPQVDAAS